MRNLKILIQYDGTDYCGWQLQPDKPTIQGEIEKALLTITKKPVRITGAGRTDSGVHALGQVANFETALTIPEKKFVPALNSNLPYDIRILSCKETTSDFNARFSAKSRHYIYKIHNSKISSPFLHRYASFYPRYINVKRLRSSLKMLIGTHDFASFTTKDSQNDSTIREIFTTKVYREGEMIIIVIIANAFLRKMVRMIIGAALEINFKKHDPEEIIRVLELKDRQNHLYSTAPPNGLFLHRVIYR